MTLMVPEQSHILIAELKTKLTTVWITEMSLMLILSQQGQLIHWSQLILLETKLKTWKSAKLVELLEVNQMFYHQQDKIKILWQNLLKQTIFLVAQLEPKIMEVSTQEKDVDSKIPI